MQMEKKYIALTGSNVASLVTNCVVAMVRFLGPIYQSSAYEVLYDMENKPTISVGFYTASFDALFENGRQVIRIALSVGPPEMNATYRFLPTVDGDLTDEFKNGFFQINMILLNRKLEIEAGGPYPFAFSAN